MFTKLEQHSWIKIVAQGRSTQECLQGLLEACGDSALPYCTVARWVKAFRGGRYPIQDNLLTGQHHMENNSSIPYFLLHADCRWTACELTAEARVCHKTAKHLQDIPVNSKLVACWISHEISEVQ